MNTININADSQKVGASKRLASALTDHMIFTMIIGFFFAPEIIYVFLHTKIAFERQQSFQLLTYWGYVGIALYFCKDCLYGQSPAKKIMQFQVVNNKTGEVAGPFRCFIRDLFVMLFPIEGIMTFVNPSRRLGDFVAGTKVVAFNPDLKRPKINVPQLIIIFLLSYAFVVFFTTATKSW